MPATQAPTPIEAQPSPPDENRIVRLHITPFRPDLLKVYIAPSVQSLAQNISYHTVETFPEKGFGYVELPEVEAQKIKKKLNGTTLRGSKVRIEMAKSEKRKAREEADAAKDAAEAERPVKRAKKDENEKKEKKTKRKEENGVLEGVELPNDRKVKRGWTEPPSKNRKDKKEKKEKADKDGKHEQRKSKYTKEPEMLFKAKLTPVAAAEVARKEKKEKKKEKKEKNKSKAREVVVHEFEKNHKTPTFLKETKVSTEKKPAVEYVNGQGWVDEDGVVVEPETGKAKARRALELVDAPSASAKAWIDGSAKPVSSSPKEKNREKKKATPPPSSSESEADDSSVVSSSSEDSEDSDSDSGSESESDEDAIDVKPTSASSTRPTNKTKASSPQLSTPTKQVHPLEALFKRAKPTPETSTPVKKLTPINTSFSFFETSLDNNDVPSTTAVQDASNAAPTTPHTQRDIEWRGLRSAAPTPDTAAIGRRFSFDWRKGSQDTNDDDEDDDEDDAADADPTAQQQLTLNTKANATARLAQVPEQNEDDDDADVDADANPGVATRAQAQKQDKPDSEFTRWFWENRGELNRAWKKRRRDALKAKRHGENKKMAGGRRV